MLVCWSQRNRAISTTAFKPGCFVQIISAVDNVFRLLRLLLCVSLHHAPRVWIIPSYGRLWWPSFSWCRCVSWVSLIRFTLSNRQSPANGARSPEHLSDAYAMSLIVQIIWWLCLSSAYIPPLSSTLIDTHAAVVYRIMWAHTCAHTNKSLFWSVLPFQWLSFNF